MPVFTWLTPSACSLDAEAISFTSVLTFAVLSAIWVNSSLTRSAIVTPLSARDTACSIICEVSLAASALRCARLRTSSATTANPLPASPARAASTAAFKASRFVWKAMSSTRLEKSVLRIAGAETRDFRAGAF